MEVIHWLPMMLLLGLQTSSLHGYPINSFRSTTDEDHATTKPDIQGHVGHDVISFGLISKTAESSEAEDNEGGNKTLDEVDAKTSEAPTGLLQRRIKNWISPKIEFKLNSNSDMPDDLLMLAIGTALSALEHESWDDYAIAKFIKDRFDKMMGPGWVCAVGNSYEIYFTYEVGSFGSFYIGDKLIMILKTAIREPDV